MTEITKFEVNKDKFYDIKSLATEFVSLGSWGKTDRMGADCTVFVKSANALTDEQKATAEAAIKKHTHDVDPGIAVAASTKYQRDRQKAHASFGDQLDQLFHDMTAGKGDKDGEWYKSVKKIKDDNPKP